MPVQDERLRIPIALLTYAGSRRDLQFILNRLVDLNRNILRTRPFPPLYESGVRYRNEPGPVAGQPPVERFQAIDVLYSNGFGDCEDLAAARVAELLNAGKDASIRLTKNGHVFHVQVQRPGGVVEDPSAMLGMEVPA